jgi:beta-mannosidase
MSSALCGRFGSASDEGVPAMLRTVHDNWTLRAVGGRSPDALVGAVVPATVPGCVHLDLLAAGLIPDPHLDENEAELSWIGYVDWRYETTVRVSPDELPTGTDRLDLVADGLDTLASIEVNGVELGRTCNQHRSYRIDLRGALQEGDNALAVTFAAAMPAINEIDAVAGRPHVNAHPFNAIRKMACNFGWDWGADLVTAGIWRPLTLHSWRTARIASVRPLVGIHDGVPTLSAHIELEHADPASPVLVVCEVAGVRAEASVPAGETSAILSLEVPHARLWWPHGYGDQPRYPVVVKLIHDEVEIDNWSTQVGFRTTELDTSADADGVAFTIRINGEPVFAKGANWIPGDSFPVRLTGEHYASLLRQAKDANVNLLRVWGGGIYEAEQFYDLCDELGIMVWQDFLLACAAYAEEQPLRGEIIAEARENVTRLAKHPSLVLWNGGNENIWGYEDWGWKQSLGGRTWGLGYYEEIFPDIVAELDPTRPYCPGSPYSFKGGIHPNDPDFGCMHIWEVWNRADYTDYATYSPRFVSEFGFQGPPTWATLTAAIHDEPLSNSSPGMLVHQKAEDGDAKLMRGMAPHLPAPTNFDDWHWATSLNQARAVQFGVESFRAQAPRCMGTVIWQLNDTWPVTSWAAIDWGGRRKPLWYAMRSAYRDRLVTFLVVDDRIELRAINDTGERWTEQLDVSVRDINGAPLTSIAVPMDVPPRAVGRVPLPDAPGSQVPPDGAIVVTADSTAGRATRFYAEDVLGRLADPEFDVIVDKVVDGYTVRVTAHTLLRDLALLVDRSAPDAVADDSLITLCRGETATIRVRTHADLDAEQLTSPLVLRTANQLVVTARNLGTSSSSSEAITQ